MYIYNDYYFYNGDLYKTFDKEYLLLNNIKLLNKFFLYMFNLELDFIKNLNNNHYDFNIFVNTKKKVLNLKTKKIYNNIPPYTLKIFNIQKKINLKKLKKFFNLEKLELFNNLLFNNIKNIYIFNNKKEYDFFKSFLYFNLENNYLLSLIDNPNIRIKFSNFYLKHYIFISLSQLLEEEELKNYLLGKIFLTDNRLNNLFSVFFGHLFVLNDKKSNNIKRLKNQFYKNNFKILEIENFLLEDNYDLLDEKEKENIFLDLFSFIIFENITFLKENKNIINNNLCSKELIINYLEKLIMKNKKINLYKEYMKFQKILLLFNIKNDISFIQFQYKYKILKEKKYLYNIKNKRIKNL